MLRTNEQIIEAILVPISHRKAINLGRPIHQAYLLGEDGTTRVARVTCVARSSSMLLEPNDLMPPWFGHDRMCAISG